MKRKRILLAVIGLVVLGAGAVSVGGLVRKHNEAKRLKEWEAERKRCPKGLQRVDETTVRETPESMWSAVGWQQLRWGMGPGDAVARVRRGARHLRVPKLRLDGGTLRSTTSR